MNAASAALEIFSGLLRLAPDIVELITGEDRLTLEGRIKRARAAVLSPIDSTEEDSVRRARLVAIIRGE